MKVLIFFSALLAAGLIAILALPDKINGMLFDEDKFASCFRSEVVAQIRSEAVLNGEGILAASTDQVLGPQLESLAYSISKNIRRDGAIAEIEKANEISAVETNKRLKVTKRQAVCPRKRLRPTWQMLRSSV